MATRYYLVATSETGISVGSYAELKVSTSAGSGPTDGGGTPTAGGNHIEITGANPFIWVHRIMAVTISSTVTFSINGLENNMANNVQPAVRVVRISNAGSILSDVVANANANHVQGTEWGTTVSRRTWTATPTSTSFSDGDWVGIIVHGDAIGTMAAGSPAAWCRFGGDAASNYDSYVEFTETLVDYSDRPFNVTNRVVYPQILAH